MKILDYTNFSEIFVTGDVHGEFNELMHSLKENLQYDKEKFKKEKHPLELENENEENMVEQLHRLRFSRRSVNYLNNSIIFVCGDCGFGFNKLGYYLPILNKINELLESTNTHLIFVRGNHDDPSYFDGEVINLSNIKAVPDYTVVKTSKLNVLCVGGAISVDRTWRKQSEARLNKYKKSTQKKLYWENEAPYFNENIINELKEHNININIVITHTSPSFTFPYEKDSAAGWLKIDPNLKTDLINERKLMDDLYNTLLTEHKIYVWSYGHFHLYHEDLSKENVLFLCNNDRMVFSNINGMISKYGFLSKPKSKKKKKNDNNEISIESMLSVLYDDNNNGVDELEEAPF